MKRLSLILIALLLTAACALPGGGSAAQTEAPASAAAEASASEGTSANAEQTSVPALADPADETKINTDSFSIVTEDGTVTQNGTVYTITAAGEYTLSGLLGDG